MNILFSLPILGIIGPTQLILIIVLLVLLFGARKIPELMRGAGRGVKEFKDAMNKDYSEEEEKGKNPANEKEKDNPPSI